MHTGKACAHVTDLAAKCCLHQWADPAEDKGSPCALKVLPQHTIVRNPAVPRATGCPGRLVNILSQQLGGCNWTEGVLTSLPALQEPVHA